MAFRVSPEEDGQLELAVKLSGLTKQDYIIRRLLCRDVVVVGSPRVYKALRNQLSDVFQELQRLSTGAVPEEALLVTLNLIAATMCGLRGDETDADR